jgi:hypothetical protein
MRIIKIKTNINGNIYLQYVSMDLANSTLSLFVKIDVTVISIRVAKTSIVLKSIKLSIRVR